MEEAYERVELHCGVLVGRNIKREEEEQRRNRN